MDVFLDKILITGGSGFIGQNPQMYFLSKGFSNIINFDIVSPLIGSLNSYWIKCDICNYELLKDKVLSFQPDYIVHLAARTDLYGKSVEDYLANTIGVANLMNVISDLPNLKKIVITSSMLVCHTGYFPKSHFDYSPTTFYGESKVITEINVWNNEPPCDWAIIRPTSIWGPWFKEPYRNFFDMVMRHRYFHIGHKGCTKTYGYVGNAVYQIEQILFNTTTDKNNKIFYIGDKPATNIEEWANEIAAELNYKIVRMPLWLLRMAAWTGDCLKLVGVHFPMTSFRLKNMTTDNIINLSNTYAIAPRPPYTRSEGIKETLNWMRENQK